MGFVWATHPNPTLADNVVSTAYTVGAYTGSLTGLPSNTLIYYDAYATNAAGTTYGGDQSFTTSGSGTIVPPLEIILQAVSRAGFY